MEHFRTRGMEVVYCDSDRMTGQPEVIPGQKSGSRTLAKISSNPVLGP